MSPKKNLWHCMDACQAGGSVVDWVMKAEGVSFRHALEAVAKRLSFFSRRSKPHHQEGVDTEARRSARRDAADDRLMLQVVDYYHAALKQSPEAMMYLERRGLRNAEMLERFKIGFCDRTLCYRLPQNNREAGADMRSRLTRLGILRESGHEHFRGSIVIPIFDEEGRVSEMYGRKTHSNLRTGTAYHTYLPGPHKGVWNIESLRSGEDVILSEALIDALTFWCAGFRNVTASYGVEGFTADHLATFKKYGTKRITIAYDRDEAGDRAARASASDCAPKVLNAFARSFQRAWTPTSMRSRSSQRRRALAWRFAAQCG